MAFVNSRRIFLFHRYFQFRFIKHCFGFIPFQAFYIRHGHRFFAQGKGYFYPGIMPEGFTGGRGDTDDSPLGDCERVAVF